MTQTETASAASAGLNQSPIQRPARPIHKWGSMEIAHYANLRDGSMYLGQPKPLSFLESKTLRIALLISAIILGAVVWIDPAGAFDGTQCQYTEGRC